MEGNKDEALRCLAISQRYRDSSDFDAARKFCTKSINLFSTPEALRLLASINAAAEASASSNGSGPSSSSSSSRQAHASASNLKNRQANGTAGGMGGDKREYTSEQLKVVSRVRSCKIEEYYEILEIKKNCEDAEIRKAYRKVRLPLNYQ
jgi:DnaJ homolog subfamily B member 12